MNWRPNGNRRVRVNSEVRQGDCLDVLVDVPERSVSLVYLDPPFFTQKSHCLRTRDRSKEFSFRDVWASHEEYAGFLHERLVQCRRTLAGNGSLFFHCDRRASHLARTLLDSVFGDGNFRSEIVWHYRRWSNSQRALLPSHQILYFYSNTDDYLFNRSVQAIRRPRTSIRFCSAASATNRDGACTSAMTPAGSCPLMRSRACRSGTCGTFRT